MGSGAQELSEIDGLDDEHVEDEREGGAEMSVIKHEHGYVYKHSLSHIPKDEAVFEPSSSSSATADPSRTTFEGACTANAARAAARADICWKGGEGRREY